MAWRRPGRFELIYAERQSSNANALVPPSLECQKQTLKRHDHALKVECLIALLGKLTGIRILIEMEKVKSGKNFVRMHCVKVVSMSCVKHIM